VEARRYAEERIEAALPEIARLKDSDFPHNHPREALDVVERTLIARQGSLKLLGASSTPDVVLATCSEALVELFALHPRLGFILRSTNVRNSFEIYRPILSLAKSVIDPDIKLILSSEWDYSPFVYKQINGLPGYVLIGLPAAESGNPLLVPLAGHELGHATWHALGLKSKFSSTLKDSIFENVEARWGEFRHIFPTSLADLRTNLIANNSISTFHISSLLQAEETFCDFLGIRIFAESYFYAYAYLISPGFARRRGLVYPKELVRVNNMIAAANEFGMQTSVPANFALSFLDSLDLLVPDERLLMSAADYALNKIAKELAKEVDSIAAKANIPGRSEENIARSYEDFKMLVPASGTNALADIINAGYRAYHDDLLWNDRKELHGRRRSILFDVILKSIEVLEIEAILRA
jgi:hypothetical protein